MSEPGSSPWTRSLLVDALGHTDTLTESPPTTWPSAALKFEEWSSTETRIEQLERRVTTLEHQLVNQQQPNTTTSAAQPMFCDDSVDFAEPMAVNTPKHGSARKPVNAARMMDASKHIPFGKSAGAFRPFGVSKHDAFAMPAGASQQIGSPMPAGASRYIASPMPTGTSKQIAFPMPAGASRCIRSPMSARASQHIASPLPAGASNSTGASRPVQAPRPMTPDEFNPFLDVDTTNWSMYGFDAFPEAVLYHHRKPDADHLAEAGRPWPQLSESETPEDQKTRISAVDSKQGSAAYQTSTETQLENQNQCVLQWATEQIRELLRYSQPGPCVALQQQLKVAEKAYWIVQAISQSVYTLSLHELGRFVVHRALCYDASLARRLVGSISQLATSSNGTLVLQRIFQLEEMQTDVLSEMLRAPIVPRIMNAAALPIWRRILQAKWQDPSQVCIVHTLQTQLQSRWTHVAMNDVGSVFIQECFQAKLLKENSSGVAELVVHCIECLCDQYGVWVIQCLVEHGDELLRRQITRQILKHAAAVCLSPYGAKAVQAILRYSAEHVLVELVDRLCEPRWHFRYPSRPLLVDVALTQQGLPLIAQVCCGC